MYRFMIPRGGPGEVDHITILMNGRTIKIKRGVEYVVREKGEWEVGGHCSHKPCRIRNADKWTIYRCSRCGYSNGRKRVPTSAPTAEQT